MATTSHVSIFTDQENVEVGEIPATKMIAPRSGDVSSSVKSIARKLPIGEAMLNWSETRSALGDVSNSSARPNSEVVNLRRSNESKGKKSDIEPPTPRKLLLPTLMAIKPKTQAPVTVVEKSILRCEDEIEIMPHNDDYYPDNTEDFWSIEERPTIGDIKWLTGFFCTSVGVTSESNDSHSHSYHFDEMIMPDFKYEDPFDEMVPNSYEPEVAQELSEDLEYFV